MNEKEQKAFDALPDPPRGSTFQLVKVEEVYIPHPYCLTPRHITEAADNFSGMLGEAAIESAEKQGAKCGMSGCGMSYKQHTHSLALFIEVEDNKDLNAVPGLVKYLNDIKPKLVELGIDGIAFPQRKR